MKKGIFYLLCIGILLIMSGCSVSKKSTEKIRNVEFAVLNEEEIPEELAERIREKKLEEFQITYTDQGQLYIAKGYGEKETDGYRVDVKECYETSNTLCIRTELSGPRKGEKIHREKTNPYVVVMLSSVDKPVIFH